MDVLEDLVVVEVVDEHGRPVPPGAHGHKVRLTSLVSRVQPLLRYELTTLSPWRAGGGPVAVHPFRLRAPFSELLEVRQYQVVHDPAGLRVAVVLRGDAPADTPGPGPGRPGRRAPGRRRGPVPDRGHPGPRIDRDPGHGAARFKLVRSRPAPSP
jgi:hypothetical protein